MESINDEIQNATPWQRSRGAIFKKNLNNLALVASPILPRAFFIPLLSELFRVDVGGIYHCSHLFSKSGIQ